jgi:pimeloyl-ACP methyl ester carboxylesterase
VDGVKVPDLFAMTPEEVVEHIFAKPETAAALYPADPTPEEMELLLRQRMTLARLAWNPYLYNPKLPRRLGRIRVPTLVVWGAQDKLFPLEIGKAWEQAIPGARLAVLDDCAHVPPFDDPEAFVRTVSGFLGPGPRKKRS